MMPAHPTFGFRGSAGVNVGSAGFEGIHRREPSRQAFLQRGAAAAARRRWTVPGRRCRAARRYRAQGDRLPRNCQARVGAEDVHLRSRLRRRARHQRGILDASGFKYGTIRLPKDEGTFTTNLTFHNGYLYVTESSKNEVWRIEVKKEGLQPYGLQ